MEQYKIAVSGSSTDNCAQGAFKKAYEVGRQIALHKCVLITGATIGVPQWATRGAKSAKGVSIGLSPASSRDAHMRTYRLPTNFMDLIIYTGFDYSGRNMLMTRASDAVIIVCGRIGTLNEFTTAFEDKRVVGILTGTGGIEEDIPDILKDAKRGKKFMIFDSDPKLLVEKVIRKIREVRQKKGVLNRKRETA
ncbi:MAG: hypothetical protein ACM3KM_03860 [Acidobacteriaceae bacterium]